MYGFDFFSKRTFADLLDLHSRPFMCHVHHWRDPIPSFIERDIERTERDMYRRSCSKDHVSRFTRRWWWWWSFCFSLHLFLMFSWLSSTHLHHSLLMISWRITDRHTMFPMVVLFPFPSFSALLPRPLLRFDPTPLPAYLSKQPITCQADNNDIYV